MPQNKEIDLLFDEISQYNTTNKDDREEVDISALVMKMTGEGPIKNEEDIFNIKQKVDSIVKKDTYSILDVANALKVNTLIRGANDLLLDEQKKQNIDDIISYGNDMGWIKKLAFDGEYLEQYEYTEEGKEELLSLGFKEKGKSFAVFISPEGEEYAFPRLEKNVGDGYMAFDVTTDNVTPEEDMYRRDLTINAMMMDIETGEIIDHVGGLKDIKEKRLRAVSEAFKEDPLRVLRLARFAATFPDFTIDNNTVRMCHEMRDSLKTVHPTRVFRELEKVLSSCPTPSIYFKTLAELDALDIVHPEIYNMIGLEQRVDFHAEGDVFTHTMLVLDEAAALSKDPIVRFGALMHDVGKPISFEQNGNFYDHENPKVVEDVLSSLQWRGYPKRYIEFALTASTLHSLPYKAKKMKPLSIYKKLFESKYAVNSDKDMERLIDVAIADELGSVRGDRKLSPDELKQLISGCSIDGVKKVKLLESETIEMKNRLIEAYKCGVQKVKLPDELIENSKKPSYTEKIKAFIREKRIENFKNGLSGKNEEVNIKPSSEMANDDSHASTCRMVPRQ